MSCAVVPPPALCLVEFGAPEMAPLTVRSPPSVSSSWHVRLENRLKATQALGRASHAAQQVLLLEFACCDSWCPVRTRSVRPIEHVECVGGAVILQLRASKTRMCAADPTTKSTSRRSADAETFSGTGTIRLWPIEPPRVRRCRGVWAGLSGAAVPERPLPNALPCRLILC